MSRVGRVLGDRGEVRHPVEHPGRTDEVVDRTASGIRLRGAVQAELRTRRGGQRATDDLDAAGVHPADDLPVAGDDLFRGGAATTQVVDALQQDDDTYAGPVQDIAVEPVEGGRAVTRGATAGQAPDP